jgi:hypothetical protein
MPLTKTDGFVSEIFQLSDFNYNSRWNEALIINTNDWLKRLNRDTNGVNYLSQTFFPKNSGSLTLIDGTNDHWKIKKCIDENKQRERYCQKLSYEGIDIFLFVEDQHIVSIVADAFQFLDQFDLEVFNKSCTKEEIENLGIEWDDQENKRKGIVYQGFESWSHTERIKRLKKIVGNCKLHNLNGHLLFDCVAKIYDQIHLLDEKRDVLFNLLPTILLFFDLSSINSGNYILTHENKVLEHNELIKLNQYCFWTGIKSQKSGGLFKDKDTFKYFTKTPLFKLLLRDGGKTVKANAIKEHLIKKFLAPKSEVIDLQHQYFEEGIFEKIFYGDSVDDSYDIFCELIARKAIQFKFKFGTITKLSVYDDILFELIKERYDEINTNNSYHIGSYFFQYRFISKILLNWFIKGYKENSWIDRINATPKDVNDYRQGNESDIDKLVFFPDPDSRITSDIVIEHGISKPWKDNPFYKEFMRR